MILGLDEFCIIRQPIHPLKCSILTSVSMAFAGLMPLITPGYCGFIASIASACPHFGQRQGDTLLNFLVGLRNSLFIVICDVLSFSAAHTVVVATRWNEGG